jgi:hydrogenase expression/formation protein HypC
MCLAIPTKIIELHGDSALVELSGIKREISTALVDDVKPGDYVIVHVGYALTKLDPVEAEATLKTMNEAGMLS